MMRRWIATFCLFALAAPWPLARAVHAAPSALPTILVANVDLIELAPSDEQYDQNGDDARTRMLGEHIRAAVAASGRYRVLDRNDADHAPPYSYNACKACIIDWAHARGANYVLVTWVQKESELILMINMALIDVSHPDRAAQGGSVDLRGDTNDTWLEGASQMLQRTLSVAMTP